jgi:hypothetical protein
MLKQYRVILIILYFKQILQLSNHLGTYFVSATVCVFVRKQRLAQIKQYQQAAQFGGVWSSMIYDMIMVRYDTICYVMVWYGMVWYGMVWYGMVWYGMVWYGI